MTFKEATDLLSVPLDQISVAIGKTYATVLAYRTGDRSPPPEVRIRLAALMREHSSRLLAAAKELDGKD
jgi:hypothetical protein